MEYDEEHDIRHEYSLYYDPNTDDLVLGTDLIIENYHYYT